jgi:hypothetical protein
VQRAWTRDGTALRSGRDRSTHRAYERRCAARLLPGARAARATCCRRCRSMAVTVSVDPGPHVSLSLPAIRCRRQPEALVPIPPSAPSIRTCSRTRA